MHTNTLVKIGTRHPRNVARISLQSGGLSITYSFINSRIKVTNTPIPVIDMSMMGVTVSCIPNMLPMINVIKAPTRKWSILSTPILFMVSHINVFICTEYLLDYHTRCYGNQYTNTKYHCSHTSGKPICHKGVHLSSIMPCILFNEYGEKTKWSNNC